MNKYDAAKIFGLSGEITPDMVKSAYHQAVKKYHPDVNPAGEEMTKVIIEAWETLNGFSGNLEHEQTEYGDNLMSALNAVHNIMGLNVEICGSWVWVTGTTRDHKERLKETGYKFSRNKVAWYFRPDNKRSFSRGKYTLNQIRTKYGSQQPVTSGYNHLEERTSVRTKGGSA